MKTCHPVNVCAALLRFVTPCLFVLSTLGGFLGIAAEAQAAVIISENFASSAGNFTVVSGGTWGVSSGRYVLSNHASSSTNGVLGNISVHNTAVNGDFSLSAVVNITGSSTTWNDAAIVFGYQDASNYYYVSLNENNDGYTKGILKVVNGVPTELDDITISISSDTDYSVEIIRSGSSISVAVNSVAVASAIDSTFTNGKVGLGTFNDSARFDDLTVESGNSVTYFQIESHNDDRDIRDNSSMGWIGEPSVRVGGASSTYDGSMIYVFELPTLAAGESVLDASLSFEYLDQDNDPDGNVDLYGLPFQTNTTVSTSMYYDGSYGGDSSATAIDDDILTLADSFGTITTSSTGAANLVAYLNDQYANGAQGGDFVFLRLNSDIVNEPNYHYYVVATGNSNTPPVLTIGVGMSGGPSGDTYYVDPTNGSMSNPGTSAQPWSTLEDVFDAGKTFNAGDIIYLRNGYHGFPVVSGHNAGNVTIQAQSGHTPTAREVHFNNASNWTLSGLTISPRAANTYSTTDAIVLINANSSDITVQSCLIYFTTSVSGWTTQQMEDRLGIGIRTRGQNTTITGNHILNTFYAINNERQATNSVISYNLLEGISGDGIRVLANDVLIEYNSIIDFYGVNDHHDDGIQSWSGGHSGIPVGGSTVYRVTIRGNTIIDTTDSSRPFQSSYGMQGIGLFDGWFEDWVVENNLVVTDMWHGISFYGAIDCKIVNNTVIQNPHHPNNRTPWISVNNHKNGQPSSGNIVRNNLVTDMDVLAGVTASNNIETTSYTSHFVDYANLDFHLKSTSSAVGAGTTTDAPSTDIEENARSVPYDVGAYEY